MWTTTVQPVVIALMVVLEVAVWQVRVALATRGRKRIAAALGAVQVAERNYHWRPPPVDEPEGGGRGPERVTPAPTAHAGVAPTTPRRRARAAASPRERTSSLARTADT